MPDGNLLILRDLFVNESIYHWSDVCEDAGLPHCYTMAMIIDPEKMGLQEIRVNDISTTFTRPKNYIEAIIGGAVFAREKWDTPDGRGLPDQDRRPGRAPRTRPAGDVQAVHQDVEDVPSRPDLERPVRLLHRHDPPAHAQGGTYEKACRDYDLWEIDQRVANYYYDITKRGFAQETVPSKIFSGAGYLPFSEKANLRSSKGRWL